MKVTIIGQIQNKKTGLGKAINDFIDFCKENATYTTTIDITNNKKFFNHCYHILVSDTKKNSNTFSQQFIWKCYQ